jgi:hypothetical protein
VAFNKRLDSLFPGTGVGLRNDAVLIQNGVALTVAASPQTTTHPATGVLAPTCSAGRLRIKIYNGGTAFVLTDIIVNASDGTNLVRIGQGLVHPNTTILLSATLWYEQQFSFILDVASSGAGGGATGQLSGVVGGATTFQIITTGTGAGGTASMDVELVPLV